MIDPRIDGGMGGRDYYDENNGWTYLWQVQHDIPGLMQLMGGKQKFEDRLDQLFREDLGRSKYSFWSRFPDATGLVGQYSMGNEPSFFIPYLYNYTDAPWNKYIQSARLNGKELKQPWLTHQELMNNGLLELEMGPKPNKRWGVME